MVPLLGAMIIAGTLTIDGFHQVSDLIAGAVIGTLFGLAAYRMMYAAIWDYRVNHIPLSRRHGFKYHAGDGRYSSFADTVATRKAAWGTQGTYCLTGGPNDVWQYHGRRNMAGQIDGHESSEEEYVMTKPPAAVTTKPMPMDPARAEAHRRRQRDLESGGGADEAEEQQQQQQEEEAEEQETVPSTCSAL